MDTQPVPGILGKLALIRMDIGAIGKDAEMKWGDRYKYRSIEALYEAIQPVLIKHNVIAIPTVVNSDWVSKDVVDKNNVPKVSTRCKGTMAYTLIDVDTNTSVTGSALFEGMDDSDKAAGKASSYGAKNFWFHFFQIPTEDPDAERPDGANYTNSSQPEKRKPGRPPNPAKAPTQFVSKEEFQQETSAIREPEKIVSTFEIATTLGELKAAWDKIPPEYRTPDVIAAKEKRKNVLQAAS
jgi:hypothetical protein